MYLFARLSGDLFYRGSHFLFGSQDGFQGLGGEVADFDAERSNAVLYLTAAALWGEAGV